MYCASHCEFTPVNLMRIISSGDILNYGDISGKAGNTNTHEATILHFHLESIIASHFLLAIHLTGSATNIQQALMPQATKVDYCCLV